MEPITVVVATRYNGIYLRYSDELHEELVESKKWMDLYDIEVALVDHLDGNGGCDRPDSLVLAAKEKLEALLGVEVEVKLDWDHYST